MPTNYPGSLDSFPTAAELIAAGLEGAGAPDPHSGLHEDLGDATAAIQTELGTNPSGAQASVAARLTAAEADIVAAQADADAAAATAATAAADAAAAQTDADTALAATVSLDARVDALEAGGPNTAPLPSLVTAHGGIVVPELWGARIHDPLGAATELGEDLTTTETDVTTTAGVFGFPEVGHVRYLRDEQVFVSAGFGTDTLTVLRGANGTVKAAHATGELMRGDSVLRVLFVGDSTVANTYQFGEFDSWPQRAMRMLARKLGLPLLEDERAGGFFPLYRTADTDLGSAAGVTTPLPWSAAAAAGQSWDQIAAGNANDLGPFRRAYQPSSTHNTDNILTWARFPWMRRAARVDVYVIIDSAGAQTVTYSLDSGTWTGLVGSAAGTGGASTLRRPSIELVDGKLDQLRLRAATTTPTGTRPIIVGADVWTASPEPGVTRGIRGYNLGRGGDLLSVFARDAGSGDPLAIISGHEGSINPHLAFVGPFTNDAASWDATDYEARLTTLVQRCQQTAEVVVCAHVEQEPTGTGKPQADQAELRDVCATVAAAEGAALLDLYAAFDQLGYTGFTDVDALGLMLDDAHLNQLGLREMARRAVGIVEVFG